MNNLTPGDRVFHPKQQAWGLGKVLTVTADSIDVFFVGSGAKRLAKSFVQLEVAEGATAKHRLLDNLVDASQIVGADYVTPAMAIERSLAAHPDGFAAPRLVKETREMVLRAHQFAIQLLGETEISELIAERRYQDVCDRARHIESLTTLLTKTEKTALYAALEQPVQQKTFALALADLLYGDESEENRFKEFTRSLHLLGLNRWPYATLFGFIRFPEQNAYIKPTLIQNVARAFCWRINYKAEPNWRTYAAVLRLSSHLRATLGEAGMVPRDMVDLHAFMASVG
jgi:hypothetical protein